MKSNEMKRLIFLLHWFLSFICKSFVYFGIFVNQNVQNIIKIGRQPSLEKKKCLLIVFHSQCTTTILIAFFFLWLHSLNPSIIKVCNLNVSARARISFHSTADLKAADKLSRFFCLTLCLCFARKLNVSPSDPIENLFIRSFNSIIVVCLKKI